MRTTAKPRRLGEFKDMSVSPCEAVVSGFHRGCENLWFPAVQAPAFPGAGLPVHYLSFAQRLKPAANLGKIETDPESLHSE